MSIDLNYCTFYQSYHTVTYKCNVKNCVLSLLLCSWLLHHPCVIPFYTWMYYYSTLGDNHRRTSGSMSLFLGGGVLNPDHWAGHCDCYSAWALFCYRHHCHCFLLQLFCLVLPWTLVLLLWFGSFCMICLLEWWLMALGRHRLGLLGILEFQGEPGVPLVLQLYVLSWYGILGHFRVVIVCFNLLLILIGDFNLS